MVQLNQKTLVYLVTMMQRQLGILMAKLCFGGAHVLVKEIMVVGVDKVMFWQHS